MKNINCHLILTALLGWSAVSGSAHAQLLLQDTFTTPATGNLSGRTPDSADAGSVTWVDGSGATVGSGVATFANLDQSNIVGLNYAGTNFADNTTYTLSGDFTFTNPGNGNPDNWLGLGFTNAGSGLGDAFDNGAAWMLNKGTASGDVQWFANEFGSSGNNTGAGLNVATMEITLALDNTGAAIATYYIGANAGSLTDLGSLSLTATQVQGITGVGFFGQTGANGTVDNFTLTGPVAAPEPSTWALLLGGLGSLVVLGRFRKFGQA